MIPPCNAIVAWNAARCFCRAVLPLTVHSGRCRSATSLRDSGVARVAPATSRAPAAISGENVARARNAEVGASTPALPRIAGLTTPLGEPAYSATWRTRGMKSGPRSDGLKIIRFPATDAGDRYQQPLLRG